MTSRYQHLNVVERIEAVFGPLANIWDKRHDVWRFESTKISQLAPILVQGDAGLELHFAQWGLLPHWFRPKSADPEAEARRFGARTFNARSETAHEKASFRTALKKSRCLVPAVSFTEWVKGPTGKQQTRLRRADGDVLVFAGLYSRWRPSKDVDKRTTFTILTTAPNAEAAAIHNRMPAVLESGDWVRWLSADTSVDDARALLRPAPDGTLVAEPVE